MIVNGRYFEHPIVNLQYSTATEMFVLRLDDRKNPQTWVEIQIGINEIESAINSSFLKGEGSNTIELVPNEQSMQDSSTPDCRINPGQLDNGESHDPLCQL